MSYGFWVPKDLAFNLSTSKICPKEFKISPIYLLLPLAISKVVLPILNLPVIQS